MRLARVGTLTKIVLAAAVASGFGNASSMEPHTPIEVNGCALLAHPARYNRHIVMIDALVNTDFEHFDLRLKCDGYIQLELSEDPRSIAKYGFKTIKDDSFKDLMARLKSVEMFGSGKRARATVIGLFRCHYDFPDCKNLSVYGDSSIVIRSVSNVRGE